jgi:death-on-curing protein
VKKPFWLSRSIVEAIHISQIREHGGLPGLRDLNALESAMARPINHWHYEQKTEIAALAAAYGFSLAKNHCFIDGNKRVAFMAMYTFLGLNGYELEATEREVVDLMYAVAGGSVSEEQLVFWLRKNVKSSPV